MRFLAVTSSFPREDRDHAGRFVFDLHAGLREEGHEVATLCPEALGAPRIEETEAGLVVRIPYTPPGSPDLFYGDGLEINFARRGGSLGKLRRFLRGATKALADKGKEADALIAHWIWPCGTAAVRASRALRVPVLGVGHGGDLALLGRPVLGRALACRLRGRLAGALSTTSAGARIMRERLRIPRVIQTPMGTDPSRFEVARRTPPPLWPSGYLLGVGRLIEIKGFDLLIAAGASVDLPVVIVGSGSAEAHLRECARAAGGQVTFTGQLAPTQVAQAMCHARAVVVPSRELGSRRTEGIPVVAVEALMARTTVIAARTGGLPDLLPRPFLFPPGDVGALGTLLHSLLREELPPPPQPTGLSRRETARLLVSLLESPGAAAVGL